MPTGVRRHRRRTRAVTDTDVPVEAPRVIEMTDARALRAHLVTDDAFAAGRADATSPCVASWSFPASLTTPETSYCASCAYWRRHEAVPWQYHDKNTDGAR